MLAWSAGVGRDLRWFRGGFAVVFFWGPGSPSRTRSQRPGRGFGSGGAAYSCAFARIVFVWEPKVLSSCAMFAVGSVSTANITASPFA